MVLRFFGFLLITLAILATTIALSSTLAPDASGVIVPEKAPPAPVLVPDTTTNTPTVNWYCEDLRFRGGTDDYTIRIFRKSGTVDLSGVKVYVGPWAWSQALLAKGFGMTREFVLKASEMPTKDKMGSFLVKLSDGPGDTTYAMTVSRLCEVDSPRRSVRMRESRPGVLVITVEP